MLRFDQLFLNLADDSSVASTGPLFVLEGIFGLTALDDTIYAAKVTETFVDADLNMDGFVDGLDLDILLGNFGASGIPASGGELTGSPPVDGLDLGILLGAWNPPPATTTVPEPTGLLLFALASLTGMTVRYRA